MVDALDGSRWANPSATIVASNRCAVDFAMPSSWLTSVTESERWAWNNLTVLNALVTEFSLGFRKAEHYRGKPLGR